MSLEQLEAMFSDLKTERNEEEQGEDEISTLVHEK